MKKIFNREVINFILSMFILLGLSFYFTTCYLDRDIYFSLLRWDVIILNVVPIFSFLLIFYLLTKRLWTSYGINFIIISILGLINQNKLIYRDDVLKLEDFSLVFETWKMLERYKVSISLVTIFVLIVCILWGVYLFNTRRKCEIKTKDRWLIIGLIILFMITNNHLVYQREFFWNKVGDKSNINQWVETRQCQIRGLIYPLIYTMYDGLETPPDGYKEKEVEEILSKYEEDTIPEDKKVNVIAIMLEAYNDFSVFEDEIPFTEDIYKGWHEIENKSIHGRLVTTVFGGGTIETERAFLTGMQKHPSYRKPTNSFVWYFKNNGYYTEALHPIIGSFYNRITADSNMGFDDFFYYENRLAAIQEDYMMDKEFFEVIKEDFEKTKEEGKPLFSFSVTYQNHGPYFDEDYEGKEFYFTKKNWMSDEVYNLINQYFSGVKETTLAAKDLVDYFDKEEEPVIVVMFGDHKPYLGDNMVGYDELNIYINAFKEEGFLNTYSTPFIIHLNESAERLLSCPSSGDAGDISPIYLMDEIFDVMGVNGSSFAQYLRDTKKSIPVITDTFINYKGKYEVFDKNSNPEAAKIIDEYKKVNYFNMTKFNEK